MARPERSAAVAPPPAWRRRLAHRHVTRPRTAHRAVTHGAAPPVAQRRHVAVAIITAVALAILVPIYHIQTVIQIMTLPVAAIHKP